MKGRYRRGRPTLAPTITAGNFDDGFRSALVLDDDTNPRNKGGPARRPTPGAVDRQWRS